VLVQAVPVSKPWAISYKLSFSQSNSMIPQNLGKKRIILLKRTLPIPALGFDEVQGHQV